MSSSLSSVDADYEAIEAAVMETARGRTFLAEYAKRRRQADTTIVLAAIEQLEQAWHRRQVERDRERQRRDGEAADRQNPVASREPSEGNANISVEDYRARIARAALDLRALGVAENLERLAGALPEQDLDGIRDEANGKASEISSLCRVFNIRLQCIDQIVEHLRNFDGKIARLVQEQATTAASPKTERSTMPERPVAQATPEASRSGDDLSTSHPSSGPSHERSSEQIVLGDIAEALGAFPTLQSDMARLMGRGQRSSTVSGTPRRPAANSTERQAPKPANRLFGRLMGHLTSKRRGRASPASA